MDKRFKTGSRLGPEPQMTALQVVSSVVEGPLYGTTVLGCPRKLVKGWFSGNPNIPNL